MLKVELKRILKTRTTWWLAAIALVLSLFFAFFTVRHEAYYDLDESGHTEITRGVKGYELKQKKYSVIEGGLTPKLLSEAVEVYQKIIGQYGDDYSVPPKISSDVLGPYSPVYTWIGRAFTDENGISFSPADLTPKQAQNFYSERLHTLERTLEKKYRAQPQVWEYAMSRADQRETPFTYSYGIGSTGTFDNLGICIFLVTLICIVIIAPIFSSDYSSGADDILRCTRRGRKNLAAAKLCSAMIISLCVFLLSIGAFFAVVYGAFGFDGQTSAELLNIAYNPNSLTTMGIMGMILLSGFLTFLATGCFTLFLSSRLKSPLAVLASAMAIAILPTVIRMFGAGGSLGADGLAGAEENLINWFRFCLPTGGLTIVGAMLDELAGLRFLWIGDFVVWSPYVVLAAAAVQIPVWFGLAVRSYSKHEAV